MLLFLKKNKLKLKVSTNNYDVEIEKRKNRTHRRSEYIRLKLYRRFQFVLSIPRITSFKRTNKEKEKNYNNNNNKKECFNSLNILEELLLINWLLWIQTSSLRHFFKQSTHVAIKSVV